MTKAHKLAEEAMEEEVGEECLWYGKMDKEGSSLICGSPAVGKGLFCDPGHRWCMTYDVCERHKGTAPWYDKVTEFPSLDTEE